MNANKQEVVLSILDTGYYEVDCDNGLIYSIRKRGKSVLKTNLLPTGYSQIVLFKGRGTGVKVICYLHQVIYLAKYGRYDPLLQIDHIDRDKENNNHYNLVAKTPAGNIANTVRTGYSIVNPIRGEQIAAIREFVKQGYSQAAIAKQLGLNRLSVRYIINKIAAGAILKYEHR